MGQKQRGLCRQYRLHSHRESITGGKEGRYGKKRSCRRTTDENIIHEKAVKMRKMTDEQLVHYMEDRVEKARSEGFNQGKQKNAMGIDISAIVNDIGNIRGIGAAKLADIKAVLESRLEVHGG